MIHQLDALQIKNVLSSNVLGRLGCNDGKRTYIFPSHYYYDGNDIYLHSEVGTKIHVMRQHTAVCFEVDQINSFTNWKSVLVWGTYNELIDNEEKKKVMQAFVDRMMHLKFSETARPPEQTTERERPRSYVPIVVYKIIIEGASGRAETDD